MKVYDLKNVEKCFVCGNIDKSMDRFIQMVTSNLSVYEKKVHPKEVERQERLKRREHQSSQFRNLRVSINDIMPKQRRSSENLSSYNNSVIIVCGNCGIGLKSDDYYSKIFSELNDVLSRNNCYVFFLRGNNDNPSIFNECKIDFEYVKAIPDYSVVALKKYNCLCIGGSTSIDKEWKLFQENSFGKKLYWENENPCFDSKELDEILEKFKISCIFTSTAPSFSFPGTNAFNKSKWVKECPSIKQNLSNERKIMDKIYNRLIESNIKPFIWTYGKFKMSNHAMINDIFFASLNSYQIINVNDLIHIHFGIDLKDKLGENTYAFNTFLHENTINPFDSRHHYEIEENEVEENDVMEEGEELDQPMYGMPNDPNIPNEPDNIMWRLNEVLDATRDHRIIDYDNNIAINHGRH